MLNTLPVESIADIFEQCVRTGISPVLLSHIDGRLRKIALQTTALWTDIVREDEADLPRNIIYLDRSGGRHIDVVCTIPIKSSTDGHNLAFLDYLLPNCSQVSFFERCS